MRTLRSHCDAHCMCGVAHHAQATSLKKHLLELKIERITQTGIDQMPSPPPSPTAESTVLDIATAQVSHLAGPACDSPRA